MRDILIVGATGQQGASVIASLSPLLDSSTRILALTRSISSPRSQAFLTKYPHSTLVQGDTSTPAPIFTAHPTINAIFLVTVPPNDEAQALPFIEAAVQSSTVDHIVFSSVDRGGDDLSWSTPTDVPHFAAKHRIELRLRELCTAAQKRWTILRPTGFMDTYNPGFFGKFMASLWANGMPLDCRMQLISTRDIGVFAAKALVDPGSWAGKSIALAGDELSFLELKAAFEKVVGQPLPQTYGVLATPVLWFVKDASASFEWFKTYGWRADITALRKQEPGLQTFEMWLKESSKWET